MTVRHPGWARHLVWAAAGLLAALAAAGCGGDDDATAPTNASGAGATPATSTRTLKAAAVVPDLGSLGYVIAQQGPDAATTPKVDVHRVLWQKSGTNRGALGVIYVFADEAAATQQFTVLADALRNPPPDYLGGAKANWTEAPSAKVGNQQKSYITSEPDGQGNRAWTDVYRMGRVIAIVQLLDSAQSDQMPTREAIAKKLAEKAK
jgi:hypothetical protein